MKRCPRKRNLVALIKRRFQLGALLLEAPLELRVLAQERWSRRVTFVVIGRACLAVTEAVEVYE